MRDGAFRVVLLVVQVGDGVVVAEVVRRVGEAFAQRLECAFKLAAASVGQAQMGEHCRVVHTPAAHGFKHLDRLGEALRAKQAFGMNEAAAVARQIAPLLLLQWIAPLQRRALPAPRQGDARGVVPAQCAIGAPKQPIDVRMAQFGAQGFEDGHGAFGIAFAQQRLRDAGIRIGACAEFSRALERRPGLGVTPQGHEPDAAIEPCRHIAIVDVERGGDDFKGPLGVAVFGGEDGLEVRPAEVAWPQRSRLLVRGGRRGVEVVHLQSHRQAAAHLRRLRQRKRGLAHFVDQFDQERVRIVERDARRRPDGVAGTCRKAGKSQEAGRRSRAGRGARG